MNKNVKSPVFHMHMGLKEKEFSTFTRVPVPGSMRNSTTKKNNLAGLEAGSFHVTC